MLLTTEVPMAPRRNRNHLYFAHTVSVNSSIVNAHDALIWAWLDG
ncbi:MAG: hypothetical protein JWQ32_3566 [Marmoricola sp.]|jgi:hypothetical protein|nr:hypothetical protein [Marmoricola sp.]